MQPLSSFSSTQRNLQLVIFTGAQLPINGDCVFDLAYRVYLQGDYKSIIFQPPPPSVARDPSQPSPFTRNTTGPLKLVLPASLLNNSHASKVGTAHVVHSCDSSPTSDFDSDSDSGDGTANSLLLDNHHCELRLKILQAFNKQFTISAVEYCD